MQTIEEYYEELYQEVVSSAEAQGEFKEDAFFDQMVELLIDAGEFDYAERSYFQPSSQRGIRVDGFCGDPLEVGVPSQEEGYTLGLIVLDYSQDTSLSTLTNTDMEADFRRLEKYLIKALDARFRASLEPTDPGFNLADMISSRWEKISRVNLFLLTNKLLSKRIEGKKQGDLDNREIVYNVWDIERIKNLVESGKEREPLHIDFNELPTGPIPTLLASSTKDRRRVFLAAIPGADLAAIYDRWGTRLLEANVRVFLQARSNVNKGIRRTLENEPELFFSFNNGITATAERVGVVEDDDGLKIASLENLQIVNGAQTTASIYAAFKAKKDLGKVFVQMKLSEISPEDAKDLVPRISEFANSQNKVSAADFFANHPYHIRIEDFSRRILAPMKTDSFTQTKWYYERARGSYRDAQAYLTPAKKRAFVRTYPKAQTFSKTDLAKYLMVWGDKGYLVNRGAQKNFAEFAKTITDEWEKNDKQFNEYYFKRLIAKKIIFDSTGKIVQGRDWYEAGGYRSQHVVLTIGVLSGSLERMGKSLDFLAIWNRQDIDPQLEKALELAADKAHEVLMSPAEGYRNISEWAKQQKCWLAVRKADIQWDEEWIKKLNSLEDERDIERQEAKSQGELNGIEAQTEVVEAGPEFWKKFLSWCLREGEGSEKELGILKVAAQIPAKLPSDKQSVILIDFYKRMRGSGCPYKIRASRSRV